MTTRRLSQLFTRVVLIDFDMSEDQAPTPDREEKPKDRTVRIAMSDVTSLADDILCRAHLFSWRVLCAQVNYGVELTNSTQCLN